MAAHVTTKESEIQVIKDISQKIEKAPQQVVQRRKSQEREVCNARRILLELEEEERKARLEVLQFVGFKDTTASDLKKEPSNQEQRKVQKEEQKQEASKQEIIAHLKAKRRQPGRFSPSPAILISPSSVSERKGGPRRVTAER